jgi:hypothetical protein
MLQFVTFLIIVVLVVGFGIYYGRDWWMPVILDSSGKPNVEAIKVIAASVATAVAALIAAGASILNVGLQLKAGKSLEETKRRLAGELERDKAGYTKELERDKKGYASELERDKAGYTRELERDKKGYAKELEGDKGRYMRELESHKNKLSLEKAETERQLARLDRAREVASSYRYAVALLREDQYRADEIEELQKRLADVRDDLNRQDILFQPWITFFQHGHNLNQRAKDATRRRGTYAKVWNDVSQSGTTYGIDFARSAEAVLAIIQQQRLEVIEAATRPTGQTV